MELGAVIALQREILQFLTDLMTNGRVAIVTDLHLYFFDWRFLNDRRFRDSGHLDIVSFFHLGRFGGHCHICSLFLLDIIPDHRIEEIEPHEGETQYDQRHAPKDAAQPATLLRRVRCVVLTALLRGLEGNPARLDGNRALIADAHTLAAVNALVVAHAPYIHVAMPHASATVVAAVCVHLYADDVEAVEQAVDRPQRADETAEAAVAEHAYEADHQHDDELAGEQDAQHAIVGGVGGIGQMAHRALEGARRTDVFTEARQGDLIAQAVPKRYGDHEHGQNDVFQP